MSLAPIRFQVRAFREEINDEKKQHAGNEINAQGMNVAGALAFHEFVR